MFSWIGKAIPRPAETPRKSDGQESPEPPGVLTKTICVANETSNPPDDDGHNAGSDESSVLGWLAQGLGKMVPQPVDSPSWSRANKEEPVVKERPKPAIGAVEQNRTENGPTEQTESSSIGVLSWLSHGLEKVVPQPSWTQKTTGPEQTVAPPEQKPQVEEKPEKSEEMNIPPGSPVHSPVPPLVAAPTPAPAEAPSAPTPEVKAAVPDKGSGVGVLNWLMQGLGKVVPEVPMAEAKKVEEEKAKEEEPPAPPPEIRKDSKVSGESAGVLSWITQGLEKVIPQPVTKQDSQNNMICQVREKGSGV